MNRKIEEEGKAALVRQDETRAAMCDISGVCTWMTSFIGLPVDIETIANFLTLGLGETISIDDVGQAGLRMQYLARMTVFRAPISIAPCPR